MRRGVGRAAPWQALQPPAPVGAPTARSPVPDVVGVRQVCHEEGLGRPLCRVHRRLPLGLVQVPLLRLQRRRQRAIVGGLGVPHEGASAEPWQVVELQREGGGVRERHACQRVGAPSAPSGGAPAAPGAGCGATVARRCAARHPSPAPALPSHRRRGAGSAPRPGVCNAGGRQGRQHSRPAGSQLGSSRLRSAYASPYGQHPALGAPP